MRDDSGGLHARQLAEPLQRLLNKCPTDGVLLVLRPGEGQVHRQQTLRGKTLIHVQESLKILNQQTRANEQNQGQ